MQAWIPFELNQRIEENLGGFTNWHAEGGVLSRRFASQPALDPVTRKGQTSTGVGRQAKKMRLGCPQINDQTWGRPLALPENQRKRRYNRCIAQKHI
jgi:hypothetical protein